MFNLNKNGFMRKILRSIFWYDEDFIMEWPNTVRKGFFSHLLKKATVYSITFIILGFFFMLKKLQFFGFEQIYIIPGSLIVGIVIGCLFSVISWNINNDRYSNLKEKMKNNKFQ